MGGTTRCVGNLPKRTAVRDDSRSASAEHGHFLRGDLAEADGSVDHRPIADPGEDCLYLAVTDAPLRLTGPVGRLLNPSLHI